MKDSDTKQIPEWEQKLGVLLRELANANFDCGEYSTVDHVSYSELEWKARVKKQDVIDFVRSLLVKP